MYLFVFLLTEDCETSQSLEQSFSPLSSLKYFSNSLLLIGSSMSRISRACWYSFAAYYIDTFKVKNQIIYDVYSSIYTTAASTDHNKLQAKLTVICWPNLAQISAHLSDDHNVTLVSWNSGLFLVLNPQRVSQASLPQGHHQLETGRISFHFTV